MYLHHSTVTFICIKVLVNSALKWNLEQLLLVNLEVLEKQGGQYFVVVVCRFFSSLVYLVGLKSELRFYMAVFWSSIRGL